MAMIRSVIVSACLLLAFDATALAGGQYCIVKVGDLGDHPLIGRSFHRIPGLAPVFTPVASRERYTLSPDRRLIPYGGPYPYSYLDRNPDPGRSFAFWDHWKTEPWSGRIVAQPFGHPVVAILEPGSHAFLTIGEPHDYNGPFILPRSHKTIVAGRGGTWVVGQSSLEPWEPGAALVEAGAGRISAVYEAPSIQAVLALDTAHRLWGSLDGRDWRKLASLDNAFGNVFNSPAANAALFVEQKSVTKISKTESAGTAILIAETLSSTDANGADRNFAYLPLFGQVLRYARGSLAGDFLRNLGVALPKSGWQKLTPRGFAPLPGGDDADAAPHTAPGWKVKTLGSIGAVLIDGAGGLFMYDGKQVAAIRGGERAKIGKYPMFYDLPSIKRTLVKTPSGLKALSDHELVEIPAEFARSPLTVSDWPEAERAVVFSADKVSIVDQKLEVEQTLDIAGIGFDSSISGGTNPETGDLIFTGKRGTYLIVDTIRNGNDACISNGR